MSQSVRKTIKLPQIGSILFVDDNYKNAIIIYCDAIKLNPVLRSMSGEETLVPVHAGDAEILIQYDLKVNAQKT